MDTDRKSAISNRQSAIVRHRLSPERLATLQGHAPKEIRAGDRYDRILRRLLEGVNWAEKNPRYVNPRNWHRSTDLTLAALSEQIIELGNAPAVLHIPISTYISGCELHLEDRWPGMTIDSRPVSGRGGEHAYRIATVQEEEERKRLARLLARKRVGRERRGERETEGERREVAQGLLIPASARELWPS